MRHKNLFYNSSYYKIQPFQKKLKMRWKTFVINIYVLIDVFVIGKLKHGLKYNGQDNIDVE